MVNSRSPCLTIWPSREMDLVEIAGDPRAHFDRSSPRRSGRHIHLGRRRRARSAWRPSPPAAAVAPAVGGPRLAGGQRRQQDECGKPQAGDVVHGPVLPPNRRCCNAVGYRRDIPNAKPRPERDRADMRRPMPAESLHTEGCDQGIVTASSGRRAAGRRRTARPRTQTLSHCGPNSASHHAAVDDARR